MDRTVSILAAALIAAAPLWAQPQPVVARGSLTFPAGTRLEPSQAYSVEVIIGGQRVAASFKPEPGATPAPSPTPPKTPDKPKETPKTGGGQSEPKRASDNPPAPGPQAGQPPAGRPLLWLWIALAVLASVAAGAAGFWYYYRRYLPRKELEPYWNALRAIRARNYEAALPGLTGIESRLPPDLREHARFFIALCHVHLDQEVEAEHLLSAIHREQPGDRNVAYLLAYVYVRRGLDLEAEPIFETMRKHGHEGFRDTRRLIGIVKFRRGMAAYRAGAIDDAADLFAEVAKLGDFAAFIPSDLRNRHISLGTRALFDRDAAGAREHFESLRKAASGMPDEQGKPLLARAGLGLVLAAWIEEGGRKGLELEKSIAETCLLLYPEGPTELPWPEPEAGSAKGSAEALKRALEAADKNFELSAEQRDLRRCLRDLHLLRALEVMRHWCTMDGPAAANAIPEKIEQVLKRLACSRALDERFADVYLIAGLLNFHLHKPGPERTTAVDLIDEARKLGVREPHALEIVNNRDRLERENADAVDKYQQALDVYLRDETVRHEVRCDLLKRLATHRSLMNRYKPPDLSRARTVAPTVQEMYTRSEMLRQRVDEIQSSKPNESLAAGSENLMKQGEALSAQAKNLENAESELLVMTGELLFGDQ